MAKKTSAKLESHSTFYQELASDLNKKFKSADKVAYFLDGQELSPADVTEWVSTGSDMLDLAISNRPGGGYPVGRIVELTGLEASGKSLLAAYALKSTQEAKGIGVYIDTENSLSREFLEAIGVKFDDLLYVQLDTIEDMFEAAETIIEKVRTSDKDVLLTIVMDSIMGASTKAEIAATYDKEGFATTKAITLSKAMRKITNYLGKERILLILTNQLRERVGITFGEKYTTSGGKAIGFHSSVRIRLKSLGQIKVKGQVVGIKTEAKVIKNRLGPPLRTTSYDIYFSNGIDNYGSWLSVLVELKYITVAGAWYKYDRIDYDTGEVIEEIKFQSKDFYTKLIVEKGLRDELYALICQNMVLHYEANKDGGIDDIEIDTDFEGEES